MALAAPRAAAGSPPPPVNPVEPGSSISFAVLGKRIPANYQGGERVAGGRTLYDNGGVPVLVQTRRGKVVLIESRSGHLTLFGQPLSAGYGAFSVSLKHTGWRMFACADGAKGATMLSGHGNETLVEWTGHHVFVAMSVGHGVPAACPAG